MNNSKKTNVNLEQLRVFVGVAEQGGVNAAAEKLFKSPSTVSHALSKLQAQLELALFEQQGRTLHLTETGMTLLKQARLILDEKQTLLSMAEHLRQNNRGEIALAVDAICPHDLLLGALATFAERFPLCHVKLNEGILSGSEELLLSGQADVCIAYRVPQGFLGEKFLEIAFVAVVRSDHMLAGKREISSRQLMVQRQVVISDSGSRGNVDSGWLKATERWTVSSMYTAIEVIKSGMAFGWIPEHLIRNELASGELVRLSIGFGGEKAGSLFITLADEHCSMSRAFTDILKQRYETTMA